MKQVKSTYSCRVCRDERERGEKKERDKKAHNDLPHA